MGKFKEISQHLIIQVTPELCALLKLVPKAHPELQAILINVQQISHVWLGNRIYS